MKGHVDAESLALYAEGQLSRGRTARVRAHLSGCPQCATTLAALAEVTIQLSHVPAAPIPSPVAARLDAALSAESAHRAAAPAGAPEPRPPRRGPLWSPRALRILAAAGVTLVAAGGIGYAIAQSGPSGTAASASSPAAKPAHRPKIQAGPNISPGGPVVRPNTPSNGSRYARSHTDYRRGTLAAQAKHALAEYTVGGLSGPGLLVPTSIPLRVRDCVARTAKGRPVRLVDLAHYQGRPAIVIMLGDPDTVTAVSYSSCTVLRIAQVP